MPKCSCPERDPDECPAECHKSARCSVDVGRSGALCGCCRQRVATSAEVKNTGRAGLAALVGAKEPQEPAPLKKPPRDTPLKKPPVPPRPSPLKQPQMTPLQTPQKPQPGAEPRSTPSAAPGKRKVAGTPARAKRLDQGENTRARHVGSPAQKPGRNDAATPTLREHRDVQRNGCPPYSNDAQNAAAARFEGFPAFLAVKLKAHAVSLEPNERKAEPREPPEFVPAAPAETPKTPKAESVPAAPAEPPKTPKAESVPAAPAEPPKTPKAGKSASVKLDPADPPLDPPDSPPMKSAPPDSPVPVKSEPPASPDSAAPEPPPGSPSAPSSPAAPAPAQKLVVVAFVGFERPLGLRPLGTVSRGTPEERKLAAPGLHAADYAAIDARRLLKVVEPYPIATCPFVRNLGLKASERVASRLCFENPAPAWATLHVFHGRVCRATKLARAAKERAVGVRVCVNIGPLLLEDLRSKTRPLQRYPVGATSASVPRWSAVRRCSQ
jgi:hypothetical protein